MVVTSLAETILQLAARIEALLAQQTSSERILVALAGVPGSGKSTVSAALLVELASRNILDVAVVPMVCLAHLSQFHSSLCIQHSN